jgi:hypothetical protein
VLIRRIVSTLALSTLLGFVPAGAETPDPPVPLFDASRLQDEPLALQIRAPWRRLRREPEEEGPYPAVLGLDGQDTSLELTVEKRGVSRQELCAMPPIRLRFEEDRIDGTLFEGNRSIKIVTHCRRGRKWEQYVMLERLAYRLYSALTDLSFRVRPATIVYEDSERDRSDGPRIAFLIEDDRLVGNRHGLDKVDIDEIRPSDLPAVETSVFMLFQYMIGNVDFSPLSAIDGECCHNAKLIGNEETLEPLYAAPYDFDSSGWVDASYAAPPANLPLRDVRQRLFRGFCSHNEGLPAAREMFLTRREDLYRILESETGLTSRNRRKSHRYLDDFFDTLTDDDRFQREITEECRS